MPVSNADTGLELAQRVRFEAAFCSLHAPGLNWVELSERLQSRIGAFILLSDGYDAELVADFEGEARFVLERTRAGKEPQAKLRTKRRSCQAEVPGPTTTRVPGVGDPSGCSDP